MSYTVEIVCDVQTGNQVAKERCHSTKGVAVPGPSGCYHKPAHAARLAIQQAKSAGWKQQRRASRPTIWVCPACQ